MVDGDRRRHVQAAPARVAQPAREVDLVGVDEEVRVQVVRPRSAATRRTSSAADWHQSTSRVREPRLWTVKSRWARARRQAPAGSGKTPRRRLLRAVRAQQPRSRERGAGSVLQRLRTAPAWRPGGARSPRSAAARSGRGAAQQLGIVLALAAPAVERDHLVDRRMARAASAEPSRDPLSSTSTSLVNGSAVRSRAIASRPRTSSSRWEVLTTQ